MSTLAQWAITQGQAEAEALMIDTCVITRGAPGEWVTDPETGYEIPSPGAEVYAGKCKVQTYEAFESKRDVGGQTVVQQRYTVHVPVSAGPFEVGDVVTVPRRGTVLTTDQVLNDATILTDPSVRRFRVAGTHEKSMQTAQRLLVDEGAS